MFKSILLDKDKNPIEEIEAEDPVDGSFFDGESTFFKMVDDPRIIPDLPKEILQNQHPKWKKEFLHGHFGYESDDGGNFSEIIISNVMVSLKFFIECFINYGLTNTGNKVILIDAKRISKTNIEEVDTFSFYPKIEIDHEVKSIKLWWFTNGINHKSDITIYNAII